MTLTVVQIVAGMLRPDPTSGTKRTVFNWLHRISGIVSFLLAVATMLSGSLMTYMHDTVKMSGTGVLAGLVVTQVLTFTVLKILACRGKLAKVKVNTLTASMFCFKKIGNTMASMQ